jgi:hypothetical protein
LTFADLDFLPGLCIHLPISDTVVWLIAISNNFLVARAANEAAVKYNPRERWLLPDGIRVVERYEP